MTHAKVKVIAVEAPLCLFAGWLIDGTGAPARRDVMMCVENGVVRSLKHLRRGELDLSARGVLDLGACTLLPGLVDCHVHLTLSGTGDQEVRRKQLVYTFEEVAPLIEERIRKHLSHGVMALRDGGDSAALTLRFKTGRLPSNGLPVHLAAAGRAWRAKGRYGRLIGGPVEAGWTLAESISRREPRSDHVKIINSGLNSLTEFGRETAPQFGLEELAAAVRSARRRGQKVMAHANGRLPVGVAVEAGCDSIEHGFFMGGENMERMAELQVFWVPTALSMKAFSMHVPPESLEAEVSVRNLDHQLEQLSRARELGVPVAAGTDAGGFRLHHGTALIEELKLFMEAGFSVEEAIRCAALDGARLLGLDRELGQLKPGMPASFIAVQGPPSALPEALCRLEAAYVRGVRVPLTDAEPGCPSPDGPAVSSATPA